MSPSARARTRMPAPQRREEILEAALTEFAAGGYHGTSTDAIARRAGISQPYLFRLFATKKELFVAGIERCFARTAETFRIAAERAAHEGAAPLELMGRAYIELLADRRLLHAQMQAYAACSDPEIRAVVRRCYGELYRAVERLSGAAAVEVRAFVAQGMLLNVAASLELPEVAADEPWVRRVLSGEAG